MRDSAEPNAKPRSVGDRVVEPVRVAHIGNVANNAYSNAKFQRRLGLQADIYHYRNEFIMGHPEWEDADFAGEPDPFNPPDWPSIRFTNGYVRPEWAKYLGDHLEADASGEVPRVVRTDGADSHMPAASLGSIATRLRDLAHRGIRRFNALSRQGQLARGERLELLALSLFQQGVEWASIAKEERPFSVDARLRSRRERLREINGQSRISASTERLTLHQLRGFPHWESFRQTCAPYDIVQLYGLEVAKGTFLPPEQPLIAFEHGTLRGFPFEQTVRGRLLALGHKSADWSVITNADTVSEAKRLGLERYGFIPHPLDEDKYVDGPSAVGEVLRRELGCELLLFCPTRHEWSDAFDSKRTDRALRVFVRYVREAEPSGAPRAGFVLSDWGRDARAAQALLSAAGVAERVTWRAPMPKLRMLDYYRAADVVVDQFHDRVGSFGAVTAEAMSCGRPVVMYFNPAVHEWCLPEMPPIRSARTEEEIYARLVELGDAATRRRVGQESRAWIERWHGWRRSTDLHLDVYRHTAERRRVALRLP